MAPSDATTHDPTPSRTRPTQIRRTENRRNTAATIALVVAWLLFASAASHASLLAEVPEGHWSYDAVERLADTGIVDPIPGRGARLPLDRYELARRVADARTLVEAVKTFEFDGERLPGDSARGVKARAIATELFVERLRDLAGTPEFRQADPEAARTADELRRLIESAEARYEALEGRMARVWALDHRSSGQIVDGEILRETSQDLEAIAADLRSGVERILAGAPAETYVGWTESENASVAEIFVFWLRRASLGSAGDESTGRPEQLETLSLDLARSLEALEAEYAAELALISPDAEAFGRTVVPGADSLPRASRSSHALGSPQGGTNGIDDGEVRSGIAGAIDRLLAAVTTRTGSDHGTSGMSFGWTPATGLSSRANGVLSMADSTKIGAEYPVTVSGVEIRAGVGVEAAPSGMAQGTEARLEASAPMFGSRGGIGASYSVVDLDRLYEVASGRRGGGGRPVPGTGEIRSGPAESGSATSAGANKVKSIAIGGTLPLGEAASIKVGYEVRSDADRTARSNEELLGAGLEYYIGSQGRVRAEYQWGTTDVGRGSSAGVNIGYRFGEYTSLSASYAMIQFDAKGDTYRDNLGEAKLEVLF